MTEYIDKYSLQVSKVFADFIEQEVLPDLPVEAESLWQGFSNLATDLVPVNRSLLAKRDVIQQQIDQWHRQQPGPIADMEAYQKFLTEIGYLVDEGGDFTITTANVDEEIANIAGPQLVVPINNARFALNAANARWGSLYDALYGTDAIPETDGAEKTSAYNPKRGDLVIAFGREVLDNHFPLQQGAHIAAKSYCVDDSQLLITLTDGTTTTLATPSAFVAFAGAGNAPSDIVLKHNGLHIIIQFNPNSPIAATDSAGISDLIIESALSAIMDCEDSVAAVDAEDKVIVYRNWLGLMKGDLSVELSKGGKTITRQLNPDRLYTATAGGEYRLHGRSLMLVRNVGHLMTNDIILDSNGDRLPEGIVDAMATVLCAMHDLKDNNELHNSRQKSVYIVKPKMHGPEEVAFSNTLFNRVEDLLSLPRNTIKVGVMDEERRTTVNLKACIREVKERLVFINTGFLDRTGDEIHTSMEAGPIVPKGDIKELPWINAYEDLNVDIGLECGLPGKAQIGKGMWAIPDNMHAMLQAKISHPQSGANCAWVPSPTAATLHALHYHQVNVAEVQQALRSRTRASLTDILTPPLMGNDRPSAETIRNELDNNCQSILGYVVRWVDLGIGCSKVPDINNVGLMEDRATLRVSSQLLANWVRHEIFSKEEVIEAMKRMAVIVDKQNAGDPAYTPMAPSYQGCAFEAACQLVLAGCAVPSGYTEPELHAQRERLKAQL